MSDDQQIIVSANRPDDCSTEQPPKCDADAAAICPVQPPKDEDAAARPVQSPNDDAAGPVPPPNDEAEIMNVVMSNDDGAAGPSPPPKDDADLGPPPNNDSGFSSPPKEDAIPAPPPKEDAIPAPTPMEDAIPAPTPEEDAIPAPTPMEDAIPAPPPKEDAIPVPPPKEDAILAPPSMDVDTARPANKTVPSVAKRSKLRIKRQRLLNKPGSSKANRSALAASCSNGTRVDVKKEMFETFDLGNHTYFYDDDNKPIKIRCAPQVGFERGLEPDHIVGATEEDGKLMFLIAWKNSEVADLLEAHEVYDRAPQIAIQFFESRLRYCRVTE